MLMRTLPLLLLGLLAAEGTRQAEALTAHLRQTALVHGTFTQTRHLAALRRPLSSNGSLVVDRERGVIWQVKKPIAMTFVMGPAGIAEFDANGQRKRTASKDTPMVSQMGRIVKSLLKGEWNAVEEYFTIRSAGSPERWDIILDPKPTTAAYLRQVRVQGAAFLERIQVVEAGGDRMELVFQDLRTDLPLSDAEARLYEWR